MKNIFPLHTADDLFRMSHDGVRRELIRGEIREMPPAGAEQGAITGTFHVRLGHHILERQLGRLFAAETGFLIARDPDTVRAPDCAFVCAERLPDPLPKKYLPLCPDLAVETISPGDRAAAVHEKVSEWLQSGVRLVWVLDTGQRTAAVHRAGTEMRVLGPGDYLDGEDVVPGFRIGVRDLWA